MKLLRSLLGFVVVGSLLSSVIGSSSMSPLAVTPSTWDWRTTIGAWPVRNQGNCAGGWAFASNAVMEAKIAIIDQVAAPDLSEQYLVSCNWWGYSCSGGGTASHDLNGWMKGISQFNSGAVLESNFPWSPGASCGSDYTKTYRNQGWTQIDSPSAQTIADTIYNYGPVFSTICAGEKFRRYQAGIFNTSETCAGGYNHSVAIVGFDLTNGYWIIRNSYSNGWGESGYMRIAQGTSGIGSTISYLIYDGSQTEEIPKPKSQMGLIGCDALISDNTNLGTNQIARYGYLNWLETGPERWVQFRLDSGISVASVRVGLSGYTGNLDVFVMGDARAVPNPRNLISFGDHAAYFSALQGQNYYISVDGRKGISSSYTLTTTCNQNPIYLPLIMRDYFGGPTSTPTTTPTGSLTPSATTTSTPTKTLTPTVTLTPTETLRYTPTVSITPGPFVTRTHTPTRTPTTTITPTPSNTPTNWTPGYP